MSLFKVACAAVLALALGACQTLFSPNLRKPVDVTHEKWEQIKPGCATSDCPLVNVDTVHFPDQPQLDSLVQRRLLDMTRSEGGSPVVAPTLKGYADAFVAQAPQANSTYLQAKVREQHDGLVIIELSSYLSTGGAHGMPGRGFINWSRAQQKVLTLDDMLVPGKEEAFWELARQAHQAWLVSSKLDQDAQFVKDWPFQKTPNIALTYGAVVLKYGVYTIAPYAMGHTELKIPYPRLNGILKPELFPGRG